MKTCNKCGQGKDPSLFGADKRNSDGLQGMCRKCQNENSIKYYKTERGGKIIRAYAARYSKSKRGKEASKKWLAVYSKTTKWKESRKKTVDKYNKRNPEKQKARSILRGAVVSGRIERMPCSVCGETYLIHAHHEDYSKPLDVIWLCAQHHKDLHNHKISLPEWGK